MGRKWKSLFQNKPHRTRGSARKRLSVSGCLDLNKLDARETLLTEISNDIKGDLANAEQSINENAETILGKVRSGQFSGRVSGLRFTEQYYERYKIGDVERVDCHTLGEISKADFDQMKATILYKIEAVDPRLKEQIMLHQIDFFKNDKSRDVVSESPTVGDAIKDRVKKEELR